MRGWRNAELGDRGVLYVHLVLIWLERRPVWTQWLFGGSETTTWVVVVLTSELVIQYCMIRTCSSFSSTAAVFGSDFRVSRRRVVVLL